MTEPLNQNVVRYLLNSTEFTQYMQWVNATIEELNSVTGLDGMTNEAAGEEVRIRAKALERLHQIMAPFIEYHTKKAPTIEEVQRAKDSYGL